jgi:hypothetical protein
MLGPPWQTSTQTVAPLTVALDCSIFTVIRLGGMVAVAIETSEIFRDMLVGAIVAFVSLGAIETGLESRVATLGSMYGV